MRGLAADKYAKAKRPMRSLAYVSITKVYELACRAHGQRREAQLVPRQNCQEAQAAEVDPHIKH
jgi:hypothetical protein